MYSIRCQHQDNNIGRLFSDEWQIHWQSEAVTAVVRQLRTLALNSHVLRQASLDNGGTRYVTRNASLL